jgi:acyl-CoA synthetase (AMP-forming)/AMP-acid ligase II
MDRSIATMLWFRAESSGDRIAVVERGSSTDYHALRTRAASIGLHLQSVGIRADNRVAIFLERGAEAAAAFFGVAAANPTARSYSHEALTGLALVLEQAKRDFGRTITLISDETQATVGPLVTMTCKALATPAGVKN